MVSYWVLYGEELSSLLAFLLFIYLFMYFIAGQASFLVFLLQRAPSRSCTSTFTAFCPCPEPHIQNWKASCFVSASIWLRMWRNTDPFHKPKLISFLHPRNIPADITVRLTRPSFFRGLRQKSIPRFCDIRDSHYQHVSLDLKKIHDHIS